MKNDIVNFGRNNEEQLYLQCVFKGILGYLRNRIKQINYFENDPQEATLPVFGALTGSNRFIMDAFYDDIPDTKVNMNTDSIPRGVLTFKSQTVKIDEFANPNVMTSHDMIDENDEELISIYTYLKLVPIKITCDFETIASSVPETFLIQQLLMENLFMYKYFQYTYKRIPFQANFNFIPDTPNNFNNDFSFGPDNKEDTKTLYNLEIHTVFPIFDYKNAQLNNANVNWLLKIQNNEQQIGGTKTDI